jgi:hypothetical protein
LRDGVITTYLAGEELKSNTCYAVYRDRSGTLWAGTRDGLYSLDPRGWRVQPVERGLPNESVRAFAEDAAGNLWMATLGGLVRLGTDPAAFTTSNGLRCGRVLTVAADDQGNVWAGTDGGGLVRWRRGKLTCYGPAEGLCDEVICQILVDRRTGILWLGCNRGIVRVSRHELDEVDAGTRATITPVLYSSADGMRSGECNGGNQSAGCWTRGGQICFATMRGLVMLDPQSLSSSLPRPPVLLEEVLFDGRPIDPGQSADLPPGKGELEFHYTALSFLAPDRLRFRYRLEGYDEDWIEAGARREAYYTNLLPGEYHFRVQARADDGTWQEARSAFAFRLQPRFFQTWWFYTAFALGALGLAVVVHQLRVRRLQRAEERLRLRVEERTRELRRAQERAEEALAQVKQLRGLLPICAYCKKIRDQHDYWHHLETYLTRHSEANFSHGICPECYDNVVKPELENLPPILS